MSAISVPPNAQLEEMMQSMGPLPAQTDLPFPASTKQAAGVLGGILTDVMAVSFSDKIIVTVSQKGKLAQWLHVPLENTNPGTDGYHTLPDPNEDGLLPLSNLTATSVLGARGSERETIGQLYACQIASMIATKNPDEKRLLVVGLGLDQPELDRDMFFGVIDLVMQCL
ncbi:hypothetical protein FQN55_009232 [Onygenales sp. PD_40]|nr:hypothetical protein FQN55_009232 [Onygenales sp. PD_40]KAK2782837.1 hypothetical protein FQN52_000562 [Onygenales sp. PD_12]KAK2789187.1 hypothetical protein FQN51_002743 [Onygenales sp. PD_10]